MELAGDSPTTFVFKTPVATLALLFGAMLVFGDSLSAAVPHGVFSLSGAGNACNEAVLTNPSVDGVSIRQDWKDLEPSEGIFDWSFLDSEVSRITAAGRQVLLRINTQAGKPAWVTSAVTRAGGTFFTFDDAGVQTVIPVFWDPTFLAKKKTMIAALGAHFADNPVITIVWASFANASSEDWSVPHTPPEVQGWLTAGYTSAKLLDAGQQIIDATMAAFPKQYVTLAVAGDGNLDPDPNYVARNAVLAARTAWPGRLIVQKNNLANFNPPAPGTGTVFQLLWDSQPDIGGQMLFNCFADKTYRVNHGVASEPTTILHQSVNAGAAYGMNYIEIYQVDVLNLPIEITYAHDLLLGLVPPINAPKAPIGLKIEP